MQRDGRAWSMHAECVTRWGAKGAARMVYMGHKECVGAHEDPRGGAAQGLESARRLGSAGQACKAHGQRRARGVRVLHASMMSRAPWGMRQTGDAYSPLGREALRK